MNESLFRKKQAVKKQTKINKNKYTARERATQYENATTTTTTTSSDITHT